MIRVRGCTIFEIIQLDIFIDSICVGLAHLKYDGLAQWSTAVDLKSTSLGSAGSNPAAVE